MTNEEMMDEGRRAHANLFGGQGLANAKYGPNDEYFLKAIRDDAKRRTDEREAYLTQGDGLDALRASIAETVQRIDNVGWIDAPLVVKKIEALIDAKVEAAIRRLTP